MAVLLAAIISCSAVAAPIDETWLNHRFDNSAEQPARIFKVAGNADAPAVVMLESNAAPQAGAAAPAIDFLFSEPERALIARTRAIGESISAREWDLPACASMIAAASQAGDMIGLPRDINRAGPSNAAAKAVVAELWRSRIELRNRLLSLIERGATAPAGCIRATRAFMDEARAAEDYAIMVSHPGVDGYGPGLDRLVNDRPRIPAGDGVDIAGFHVQSGDVFLIHGTAIHSSSIARMPGSASKFSHISIVYIDPADRKAYVVEGQATYVHQYSFEKYLTDHNLRFAQYRYRRPETAAKAAEWAYRRVKRAEAEGKPIYFDFDWDLSNEDAMYCAELLYHAFRHADPSAQVPLNLSDVSSIENKDFLHRLGIRKDAIFNPSDIDADPRFDLIAERRMFPDVKATLVRDAVMNQIFEWMVRDNFNIHVGLEEIVGSALLWTARRTPLLGRLLAERFPPTMPRQALEVYLWQDGIGGRLEAKLAAFASDYEAKNGRFPPPEELRGYLLKLRQADLDPAGSQEYPIFSDRLRP